MSEHKAGSDLNEIRSAINLLFEPGRVVEIRALGDHGLASGYFDDRAKLATAVQQLSDCEKYNGIYYTLNPCDEIVLGKVPKKNTIQYDVKSATRDAEIALRYWLLLDFDPQRPKGTSSTKEEKQAARKRAKEGAHWLAKRGWAEPLLASSGNGYHLIYPVNEPNNSATKELFKTCLRAISQRLSTPDVEVDTSVYNAARITKAYGSRTAKGEDTYDRPHRYSEILIVPTKITRVTHQQLESLAATLAKSKKKPAASKQNLNEHAVKQTEEFLEWAGIEFEPWVEMEDGTKKWILKSCPFNAEHDEDDPAVFLLPNGARQFKCFHKSCSLNKWAQFRAKIEKQKGETFPFENNVALYLDGPDGIYLRRLTNDGERLVQLTNFKAQIVTDIEEDDGVNFRHEMRIEAAVGGRNTSFLLPASEFKSMAWVLDRLGCEAVIFAGQGTTDHARAAIQLLSTNVERERIYMHTGWRRIDRRWMYLHGDGAIGAKGLDSSITVKLPPQLLPFRLPTPPTGERLKNAVRASLALRDAGPHSKTVPVYAALYRGAIETSDFSVHWTGQTGTFKSSVMACALQHFGKSFNRRKFPASWNDTENHIGQMQFLMKDAPLAIDDFVLKGGQVDMNKMHAKADRVFRGQGNLAGRGRMRQDGVTLRNPAPPRGVTLSTGEDIPRGESLQTRVWITELSKDDIDFEKLQLCQQDGDAGLYAEAMSAYIKWIAADHKQIVKKLHAQVEKYCSEATSSGQHARTPEITGNLMAGIALFVAFATEAGAISVEKAKHIRKDAWTSLLQAAAAQVQGQASEDPATRFVELLSSALVRGNAHLGSAITGRATDKYPKGLLIGWYSDDDHKDEVWIEMQSAYATVQELARQQQEPFPVRLKTLGTRLRDSKLLAEWGPKRNTCLRKIGGSYKWVLCLKKHLLQVAEDEDELDVVVESPAE